MSTEFDQQRLRNEFTVPTPNTELHLQQSVKTTQQTVDSMNHVQFYKKKTLASFIAETKQEIWGEEQ